MAKSKFYILLKMSRMVRFINALYTDINIYYLIYNTINAIIITWSNNSLNRLITINFFSFNIGLVSWTQI